MEFKDKAKRKILKLCGTVLVAATLLASAAPPAAQAGYSHKKLVPMGNAVGISMEADGALVVGIPEFLGDGTPSPARSAGFAVGDIITHVGKKRVCCNEEIRDALAQSGGKSVTVTVTRGKKTVDITVTPHINAEGRAELGLWLRDAVAGIGTITFYDPETGIYGALGHSVSDTETGILIPLRTGTILKSSVTDVAQGKIGFPGQLHGTFNADNVVGNLVKNSPNGIFGQILSPEFVTGREAIPVADTKEIHTGPATILSNVSGTEVCEYTVEITRLYTGSEAAGRSMMLTVTDPRLIEQTGGIVQGMSGSPIIQDGKLIGAVTHVLINDPTRGYGLAIEKMLDTVYNSTASKKAA